jgi:hypothetical protein
VWRGVDGAESQSLAGDSLALLGAVAHHLDDIVIKVTNPADGVGSSGINEKLDCVTYGWVHVLETFTKLPT